MEKATPSPSHNIVGMCDQMSSQPSWSSDNLRAWHQRIRAHMTVHISHSYLPKAHTEEWQVRKWRVLSKICDAFRLILVEKAYITPTRILGTSDVSTLDSGFHVDGASPARASIMHGTSHVSYSAWGADSLTAHVRRWIWPQPWARPTAHSKELFGVRDRDRMAEGWNGG